MRAISLIFSTVKRSTVLHVTMDETAEKLPMLLLTVKNGYNKTKNITIIALTLES